MLIASLCLGASATADSLPSAATQPATAPAAQEESNSLFESLGLIDHKRPPPKGRSKPDVTADAAASAENVTLDLDGGLVVATLIGGLFGLAIVPLVIGEQIAILLGGAAAFSAIAGTGCLVLGAVGCVFNSPLLAFVVLLVEAQIGLLAMPLMSTVGPAVAGMIQGGELHLLRATIASVAGLGAMAAVGLASAMVLTRVYSAAGIATLGIHFVPAALAAGVAGPLTSAAVYNLLYVYWPSDTEIRAQRAAPERHSSSNPSVPATAQ